MSNGLLTEGIQVLCPIFHQFNTPFMPALGWSIAHRELERAGPALSQKSPVKGRDRHGAEYRVLEKTFPHNQMTQSRDQAEWPLLFSVLDCHFTSMSDWFQMCFPRCPGDTGAHSNRMAFSCNFWELQRLQAAIQVCFSCSCPDLNNGAIKSVTFPDTNWFSKQQFSLAKLPPIQDNL